ncbi:MAG: hypothetical protein PHX87_02290 [Candidatus Peribacteraceae bacterium]|nr:hypothetical protein [Candidatus Peribacteraceae bacterium]MDD5742236.1 hypothetical protein [Candidatus Peribacteraceae bacterium]
MTTLPAAITGKLRADMPGPREVLRRVLFPFALFSVVLLALLLLSWYLLLPRFTRVELHGVPQDPSTLQTYVQDLQDQTKKMEEKRLALILPLEGSPYGILVQEKMSQPSLLAFHEQLKNVARTFLPEQSQAVFIQSISFERDAVILTGDVRNVGLQSMAVLAQFVSAVRAMPGIGRVDFPSFTRERDESIGFHSPFTLRIHFS